MLARLLPHELSDGQRIGKADGGGLLDQSLLTSPKFVSWNATLPMLVGASSGLPWSLVVQSRVKLEPFVLSTVTFSSVGVVL